MSETTTNQESTTDNLDSLAGLQASAALERTVEVTRKVTARDDANKDVVIEKPDSVFIRPLVFSQWLKGLKSLKNIIAAIPDGGVDLSDPAMLALFIVQILADAQDDVLAVASMAINRPVSFFDELEMDEAIKVMQAVFEVNRDFFTRKLMPMLEAMSPEVSAKLKTATAQIGQTQ